MQVRWLLSLGLCVVACAKTSSRESTAQVASGGGGPTPNPTAGSAGSALSSGGVGAGAGGLGRGGDLAGVGPAAGGVAGVSLAAGTGGVSPTGGEGGAGEPAGAGGEVSAGAGGAPSGPSCENPTPVHTSSGVQTAPGDTGFDSCQSGTLRRRAQLSCPWLPPTGSGCGNCASDAACDAQPLGVCADAHHLAGYCGCFYDICHQDQDCKTGQICVCGGPLGGRCTEASCVTDADCGPGLACVATHGEACFEQARFACQTPADECLGDLDCGSAERCILKDGRRTCVGQCPI